MSSISKMEFCVTTIFRLVEQPDKIRLSTLILAHSTLLGMQLLGQVSTMPHSITNFYHNMWRQMQACSAVSSKPSQTRHIVQLWLNSLPATRPYSASLNHLLLLLATLTIRSKLKVQTWPSIMSTMLTTLLLFAALVEHLGALCQDISCPSLPSSDQISTWCTLFSLETWSRTICLSEKHISASAKLSV